VHLGSNNHNTLHSTANPNMPTTITSVVVVVVVVVVVTFSIP